MNRMDVAIFLGALFLAGGVSVLQGRALVGLGSDHYVHLFLVNVIRENGRRLFTRIPRLLNPAYCSAYPLFLHWFLSFLKNEQLVGVSRYYNPVVNLLQVALTYLALRLVPDVSPLAGMLTALFAATPSSSTPSAPATTASQRGRSGCSSSAASASAWCDCAWRVSLPWMGGALLAGYCVWGFNTFAAQTMLLAGLLLLAVFGFWQMMALAAASVLLFVCLHPAYGPSYLFNTFRFSKAYATDLAPLFILNRRPSIWRDLILDCWREIARQRQHGLSYTYSNPVVMVVCLNPLVLLGACLAWSGDATPPFVRLCAEMSFAGLAAFLLTSFRPTRFLGEPERYVEMMSFFSAVAGGWWLWHRFGMTGLALVGVYFVGCDLVQLVIAQMTRKHISDDNAEWLGVADLVEREMNGTPVRFASNNEDMIKWLMGRSWEFARLNSADQDYAGYRVSQVISKWPLVRLEAFEALLRMYRINVCLLDRANYAEVFSSGVNAPQRQHLLFENHRVRVMRLDW